MHSSFFADVYGISVSVAVDVAMAML